MRSREPLGNVVVATDFSRREPLDRAALLPVARGSSFTLMHALPPDLPSPLERSFRISAERRLGELAAVLASSVRANGREGVDVFHALAVGKAVPAIIARAEDVRAQLVVVGRSGSSHRADAKIGATAERVARACHVPVLVVADAPRGPYRAPFIAVDGGAPASDIVELAMRVVSADTRTAFIAHAFEAPELSALRYSDVYEEDVAALSEEYAARARRHLKEILTTLPALDVAYEASIVPGDPRRVLVDEAARRGADLIVLGTRGHGPLLRLLLGSVAEAVLREAAIDVLIVR